MRRPKTARLKRSALCRLAIWFVAAVAGLAHGGQGDLDLVDILGLVAIVGHGLRERRDLRLEVAARFPDFRRRPGFAGLRIVGERGRELLRGILGPLGERCALTLAAWSGSSPRVILTNILLALSLLALISALRAAIGSLCATTAVTPTAIIATASTIRFILVSSSFWIGCPDRCVQQRPRANRGRVLCNTYRSLLFPNEEARFTNS